MNKFDDKLLVPVGTYVAALRLVARFGSMPAVFKDSRERVALQWVVRLSDGRLGCLTHLITKDAGPGSQVRRLVAALTADHSLLEGGGCPPPDALLGLSCLIQVGRQQCGGGRDRPVVPNALPLSMGIEPIHVPDTCYWYPDCGLALPPMVPSWVSIYAAGVRKNGGGQ